MAIEPDKQPRPLRLVTGTVQQIEDWINAHWGTYQILNYAWAVIDGVQHVTITAMLGTEIERAMRMMQLAQGGKGGPQFRQ